MKLESPKQQQMGKSKDVFQSGILEMLDERRGVLLNQVGTGCEHVCYLFPTMVELLQAATRVCRIMSTITCRRQYLRSLALCLMIQAKLRSWLARARYTVMTRGAVALQKRIRGHAGRKKVNSQRL